MIIPIGIMILYISSVQIGFGSNDVLLELFTDKIAYEPGEEIILTFTNLRPDGTVTLPNGAPFSIEYQDPESGTTSVYSPMAIQVLIPVATGESKTWLLNESPGIKGTGFYTINFQVYVDDTYEVRETLYTKFTIGVPQISNELELVTDKLEYRLGEDVVLTFMNHGSEGTDAKLLNGNPFEIEFQDLETGKVTIYSLPAIEILIIVPAGERVSWTLNDAEGLIGVGYYHITFQVTVNEQIKYLNTKFSVGTVPQRSQLELFTDKFIYDLGDKVVITFVNIGSDTREVILPNGFPIEIEYRVLETGEVIVYSLPATEAEVPVSVGGHIIWNLGEESGLRGAGYYSLMLRVLVEETPESLYSWFTYGVPPSASELFTDKDKYRDGDEVNLIFINRESNTVNAGYCLDITYQMQENSPKTSLFLSCIEILVILPPGENITWTFTPEELMGPGYYSVLYKVYSGKEGRQLVFQTEFVIVPDPLLPTTTTIIVIIASEFFTDKEVYIKGENITLTFINRETFAVNEGYCLDITYRSLETSSSLPLYLQCIEILVILPPNENITWTITPNQLMGTGYYSVNYTVHNVEGTSLMFQTEFEIVPDLLPTATTTTISINPDNGMFIPGFDILVSLVGILSVLLVRARKKSKLI